ncbi:MAG: prephenate dehydrogenase [Planctomycetes bacterium ADurb.Bin412]|nr:MAG: prephenate dehydrogenase [Planctomycetes bacterium ADurb.Bin412]
MKLNQLSVFLENKPGRLSEPCKILADAGINILTISLADTQQFGILRLIVKDWQKAKTLLEKAGCVVHVSEVVAVEVEDHPGGLEKVLKAIEKAKINVEYMYAFTFRQENKAIITFRFESPDAAIQLLSSQGFKIVESSELFKRV